MPQRAQSRIGRSVGQYGLGGHTGNAAVDYQTGRTAVSLNKAEFPHGRVNVLGLQLRQATGYFAYPALRQFRRESTVAGSSKADFQEEVQCDKDISGSSSHAGGNMQGQTDIGEEKPSETPSSSSAMNAASGSPEADARANISPKRNGCPGATVRRSPTGDP